MMAFGAMLAAALPGLLYFVAVAGLGLGGRARMQHYSGTAFDTILVAFVLAIVVGIGVTALLAGRAYYRTGVASYRYHRPMLLCVTLLTLAGIAARLFIGRG